MVLPSQDPRRDGRDPSRGRWLGLVASASFLPSTVPLRRIAAIAALGLSAVGCGRILTEVGEELDAQPGAQLDATCAPTSLYIDVASGALSGGFSIQTDVDGGEYLSPPAVQSTQAPGDASADYTFPIACPGTYLLWGRMHGPGALNNTFWLSVDQEPFYQWRLSTGVIWYWRPVTRDLDYGHPIEYALDAGVHRLTVRNSATDVGLQQLFVAPPGDVPPGNDTPCNPPHSIQLEDGGCEMSCGSHGNTVCSPVACAGQPTLVAYDCSVCCHPPDAGADGGVPDSSSE
jgi:hypothetical protein